MTYSGVAAAGSELQANYGLGRFDDSPMFNKDAMLAVMKKYIVPENDRFNGEMPYQTAMYDNSGKLVDWMHKIGVGFYSLGVNKAYGITPYLAPGCYMGGCGYHAVPRRSRRGAWRKNRVRHAGDRTREERRRPRHGSEGQGQRRSTWESRQRPSASPRAASRRTTR